LAIFYEPGTFHYSKNKNTSLYTGWYRANPKLPNGCPCVQVRLRVSSQTKILHPFDKPQFVRVNNAFCKYYTVGHFPPVLVRFTLPAEYPDNSTPIFSLECTWILSDQLEQVVEQLNAYLNTKEKGEPCLWECFDFLEWQLIPELLGLPKNEDGSYLYDIEECVPTRVMREYALTVLVEHDFEEKRRRFRDEKMECPICAEDKLGRECTRLVGCGHLACHECMKAALEAHMDEGIMAGVFRCMHCDDVVDLSEVSPEIPEITEPPHHKRGNKGEEEENNNENENPEDETPTFIRYEDKAIPTLGKRRQLLEGYIVILYQ
uniref:RING-type domain-containing protein n=1 Tax=Hymenolepis diminuta TaxID=6216 RepID=A0A0R3SZ65_HYMDI